MRLNVVMNWKSLIADLMSAGWTQMQIATALGRRTQSWVADISSGRYKDLKWADGERLRKLHRQVMRNISKQSPH